MKKKILRYRTDATVLINVVVGPAVMPPRFGEAVAADQR